MPPTKLRWLIRFVNTDWNSSFNMTPKMLLVQELHFLKLLLTLLLDCVLSWVNFTNFSSNKASFQFRYFSVVPSLPSCPKKMVVVIRIRNDWNARLESIFASFCRLFVQPRDCGTLRGSKVTLMFGHTSLCVFCGLWKNKVLYNLSLWRCFCFRTHTISFT